MGVTREDENMKHKLRPSGRKRVVICVAAVCISLLALAGVRRMAQISQAARDRNNLRQQRAAMGIPDRSRSALECWKTWSAIWN